MDGSGALAIAEIAGGSASEDGDALLVVVTDCNKCDVVLSFPYDQLLTLVALAIMGRTDCKLRKGLAPNDDADIILTQRYELGWDRRTGQRVLILTMANGGKMTWGLPGDMAAQIHETLATMLGQAPSADWGLKVH